MLTLVFAIGSFAVVGSLNNLILTVLVEGSGDDGSIETVPSGSSMLLHILGWNWQGLEIGFGLIACNLPVLKPLWGTVLSNQMQRGANSGREWAKKAVPVPSWPHRVLQKRQKEFV